MPLPSASATAAATRRRLVLLSLLFVPFAVGEGQRSCTSIPHADFLSTQLADAVCHHREMWIHERDSGISAEFMPHPSDAVLQYLADLENCTRSNCAQSPNDHRRSTRAIGDGSGRGAAKVLRKEIRMMTTAEFDALQRAMNALKQRWVERNVTAWDVHTLVHYPDSAPAAHWGAAFLPWHREFLRQFEVALQRESPGVALPYWDATLDQGLPQPADSVLWSERLLGNGNGYVTTGPFRNWDTNVFMPLSRERIKRLYRSVGSGRQSRLMDSSDIDWILSRPSYSALTYCHDRTFESMHGLSHVWVGGFMYVIRVSPNDPAFYMHHAFIDHLWEKWRQQRQNRQQRENDYARNTCGRDHDLYARMKPFSLLNRDGLSNRYTDEYYEYEEVRHCTPWRKNCDSPWLWCDQSRWRCRSKVREGGSCRGFESTDICHQSTCEQGWCTRMDDWNSGTAAATATVADNSNREPSSSRAHSPWTTSMTTRRTTTTTTTTTPAPTTTTTASSSEVWTKVMVVDADGQGLAGVRVQVFNVDANDRRPQQTLLRTRAASDAQFPEVQGLAYVPISRPGGWTSSRRVQIVVDDASRHHGHCQSFCRNRHRHYEVCEAELQVSSQAHLSSNTSFAYSESSRRFLDYDMSVHPSLGRLSPPYMLFVCGSDSAIAPPLLEETVGALRAPSKDAFASHVWLRVSLFFSDARFQDYQIETVSSFGRTAERWWSRIGDAQSRADSSLTSVFSLMVRAANPALHADGVRVQVRVLDAAKRPLPQEASRTTCRPVCDEQTDIEGCEGRLLLHATANMSTEQVWTSDSSALAFLGWRMVGHPSAWVYTPPRLGFLCL